MRRFATGALMVLTACAPLPGGGPSPVLPFSFAELSLSPAFTCREDLPDGRAVDEGNGVYRVFEVGVLPEAAPPGSVQHQLQYLEYVPTGCRFYYVSGAVLRPPFSALNPGDTTTRDLAAFETPELRDLLLGRLPASLAACAPFVFWRPGHPDYPPEGGPDGSCDLPLRGWRRTVVMRFTATAYQVDAYGDVLIVADRVFLQQRDIPRQVTAPVME
jgi:hypothetical protein